MVKLVISRITILVSTFLLLTHVTTSVSLAKDTEKGIGPASEKPLFKSLKYPELEVSPLASQRLALESQSSDELRWKNQIMFQISGFSTLIASLTTDANLGDESDHDDAKLAGALIGGGWLIGSSLLAAYYNPYQKGHAQITKLKNKTKRDKITRERFSEEAINRPASLIRRLKWISWASNLAASILIASSSSDETKIYPAISGIASLLPLIFNHHWEHVAEQHSTYKKKIYGPIWGTGLIKTPGQKLSPALTMAYSF